MECRRKRMEQLNGLITIGFLLLGIYILLFSMGITRTHPMKLVARILIGILLYPFQLLGAITESIGLLRRGRRRRRLR